MLGDLSTTLLSDLTFTDKHTKELKKRCDEAEAQAEASYERDAKELQEKVEKEKQRLL